MTSQQLAKLNTPTKMKSAAGLPGWASPGGLRTFSSSCTYHYTGPSTLQHLTRRSQTPVAHYLAHSSAPNPPKTHLHGPSMHALRCLWCCIPSIKKKKVHNSKGRSKKLQSSSQLKLIFHSSPNNDHCLCIRLPTIPS